MAYSSKTNYCFEDIHHLLGATLRDSRQVREGRVVGIDQSHKHDPIIHIMWQGERQAERVAMTEQQLEQLMAACCARRDALRDDVAEQRLKARSLQTVSPKDAAQMASPLRRRA